MGLSSMPSREPIHLLGTVILPGREVIVRPAPELQVIDGGRAAARKRYYVVQLDPMRGVASPPVGGDERAAAAHD